MIWDGYEDTPKLVPRAILPVGDFLDFAHEDAQINSRTVHQVLHTGSTRRAPAHKNDMHITSLTKD